MKQRKNPPSHKEIFEEWYRESSRERKGNIVKRFFRKIFLKLAPFKRIIFVFLTIVFILLLIFIIFKIIVSSPDYSQDRTRKEARGFQKSIEQQEPKHRKKLKAAYDILKKYPYFHKEVVNNIDRMKIKSKCSYMCVYSAVVADSFGDLIVKPPYHGEKIVYINPSFLNNHSSEMIASSLVHEANHYQFLGSGKLRRAGLFIECSPFLNPSISVSSNIPDIGHRLKPMEICAEKEENEFSEARGEESHYKGASVIKLFFRSIGDALQIIWRTLKMLIIYIF